MRCDSAHEELSAYMDGEISGKTLKEIERHLEDCSDCCSILRQLSGATNMLSMLDPPKAPAPLFWMKVTQRCLNTRCVDDTVNAFSWRRWGWMGMPVAATITFGLVAWIWISSQPSNLDTRTAVKCEVVPLEENLLIALAPTQDKEDMPVHFESHPVPEPEDHWRNKGSWNAAEEILLRQASVHLVHASSRRVDHPGTWGHNGVQAMPVAWTDSFPGKEIFW